MNLVIDIGNSRTKTAIFAHGDLVEICSYENLAVQDLSALKERYPETGKAILSAVASFDPSIRAWLRAAFPDFIELNSGVPMPVRNSYKTPQTLGQDRLAAAIGASVIFPGRDLLVIDAGTAITFDLMEKNGTFAGGNISPGLRSRFRSLHEFTQNLPLVEEIGGVPLIGQTTEEAIKAGVIHGITLEMDGMIDLLKKVYNELQPVLTGGDAPFFERRLKNPIFVKLEITLIGLNRILEYNVEKQ